jgi:flagellar hook-length control protein FliK
LLQATVTESRTGKVLLAIGNRQISAETSLPLKKGQQLTLQVRSLGEQPVLKIATSGGESQIYSAIRLLLPKQGPLPPLLATIVQLAQSSNPALPPQINELVRSIVKQMPDIQTAATPQGLKKAVSESGVFLERQLLQQQNQSLRPAFINPDFKANLLRLVQLVRQWPGGSGQTRTNAPHATSTASATTGTAVGAGGTVASSLPAGALAAPLRGSIPVPQAALRSNPALLNSVAEFPTELLQQTEAALARIQLHQLAALPREGERGLLEWLFELPIRRGEDLDLWSMRIFSEHRQQQQENRQQGRSWSVQLAFELPGLGAMQVQIQLAGDRVSTRFWAEHQDTLPLLRGHMHELRRALSEAGLDVGELECQAGPRPAVKSTRNQALISEKA